MMMQGVSVLLLTSAAGYWVLTASGREKGRIKMLGQVLGLLIVVLSVAGTACKLYCTFTGTSCPMLGGKSWGKACPMGSKVDACPAGHPGCTMNCPPAGKSSR